MEINTETITNGVSKPDEQSTRLYQCNECFRSEVKSIEKIFIFKTKKELFTHYLSEHNEDDEEFYAQLRKQIADYKCAMNIANDVTNVDPYELLKAQNAKKQEKVVSKVELLVTTPQPVQQRKIAQKKVLQQSLSTDSQPLNVTRKKVNFKYSDNEDTENDQDDDALNQTTTVKKDTDLERKIMSASDQELKYFNLSTFETYKCEQTIDEQELSERLDARYAGKQLLKAQEIKKNTIVWAQWRNKGKQLWWPSRVENVTRKNSKLTITIRYFEENSETNLSQYTFKMELGKIQLFFRPIEDHFKNKIETAAVLKESRLGFLIAYTLALKEFQELSYKVEQDINQSIANQTLNDEKVLINRKKYTLDEIKKLAKQEPSDKLIKENKERDDKSKMLLEIIRSEECKSYIISILKSETECPKSDEYLKSDLKTRKKMQQMSPGPLVNEDQLEVAKMVNELSRLHFKQKPDNLPNYEHDILYPEAVIWSLKKKYSLNHKKAELKYNDGFKRTPEEILKQKCNEYLSGQQLNEDTDQSVAMQADNVLEETNNVNKSDESMPFESNDLSLSTIESNATKDETIDSQQGVTIPERVSDEDSENKVEVNEQEGSGIDL